MGSSDCSAGESHGCSQLPSKKVVIQPLSGMGSPPGRGQTEPPGGKYSIWASAVYAVALESVGRVYSILPLLPPSLRRWGGWT